MVTDLEFQQLRERVTKLEVEVSQLRGGSDWEARIAEFIRKGDMDRHASMSEAVGHVMEIKKKIGK
jgi:hypothetical protein